MQPQPQNERAPKREKSPEETLRELTQKVAEDARERPQDYLEQSRVPAGGE